MLYSKAAWNKLVTSMNLTPTIMRNMWIVVNKVTNGQAWMRGRANALHPSMEKSKDGVAVEIFHKSVEEFTSVTTDSGCFSGVKLFSDCLHAKSISNVKASVEGILEVVNVFA